MASAWFDPHLQERPVRRFGLVRREWELEGPDPQCCRGDEGRPFEVGVQTLASNQAVLLWSKRPWW